MLSQVDLADDPILQSVRAFHIHQVRLTWQVRVRAHAIASIHSDGYLSSKVRPSKLAKTQPQSIPDLSLVRPGNTTPDGAIDSGPDPVCA